MKKALSLILCLMLILSLAVPALAEEQTTTITIDGGKTGAKYALYRIMTATNSGDAYGYGTIAEYDPIYQAVCNSTKDSDIIAYIKANSIDSFAKRFYDEIDRYNKNNDPDIAPDATITIEQNGTGNKATVPQGYYLIVEVQQGTDDDVVSLHMLDTAGESGVTVTTKEDAPEIEKKVYEVNDSKVDVNHKIWQEHASYDIGDSVPFRIKVRVSGDYDSYESYYISVEDTMDPGLVYNGDLKIYISSVDGPEITEHFAIEQNLANGADFKASADLKDIVVNKDIDNDGDEEEIRIDHNLDIVFDYSATLTGDSVVVGADGNKNSAKLIYQNNPYVNIDFDPQKPDHPEGGTEETPPDVNVVFTFKAIVNKVDASGKELKGAGFTLFKYNDATLRFEKVGEEISGDNLTKFEFTGLDEGIYKLEETTVPPGGYNKADDIEFHIHAVYDTAVDPAKLTGLKVVSPSNVILGEGTYNDSQSNSTENEEGAESRAAATFTVTLTNDRADVETDIVNRTGTELPSTGGMGTTLIYIAGGILVLAAIVLLVTKKRMAGNE